MASPTGFIDFNTFYQQQGSAEEAAMQAKLDELQRLDDDSARYLRLGEGEAEKANFDAVRGGGVAGTSLSGTASYSQFLKAQQQAKALREQLAAAAKGIGNMGLGARAAANTGAVGAVDASATEEARLRDFYGQKAEQGIANYGDYSARMKAMAEKKADEDAQRQATDAGNLAKFQADMRARMAKAWAEQDAASADFGAEFNPFTGGRYAIDDKGNPFTVEGRSKMNPDQRARTGGNTPGGYGAEDWERMAGYSRNAGLGADVDKFQSEATYSWGKRKSGGF